MNRVIKSERVKGKGIVYLNKCPRSNNQQEYRVGNPSYCALGKCPYYKKEVITKEGSRAVHCTNPNF